MCLKGPAHPGVHGLRRGLRVSSESLFSCQRISLLFGHFLASASVFFTDGRVCGLQTCGVGLRGGLDLNRRRGTDYLRV